MIQMKLYIKARCVYWTCETTAKVVAAVTSSMLQRREDEQNDAEMLSNTVWRVYVACAAGGKPGTPASSAETQTQTRMSDVVNRHTYTVHLRR